MACPIEISHAGASLSPLSLFTLLTSITSHTHVHTLHFRHEGREFSLDFLPSMTVFTPDEQKNRTKYPSSFCHFQGVNQDGFRAWISACHPDRIEMILRAPVGSFTLKQPNGSFAFDSEDCDSLWNHKRDRRADNSLTSFLHNQSLPAYYDQFAHLFSRKRYIEFAMFAGYSVFEKNGKDEKATKDRVLSLIHMTNSFYDSLNIEIQLVHLSIFKTKNTANIKFTSKDDVMNSFKKYLENEYSGVHFDHADLFLAGDIWDPEKHRNTTTTGYATIGAICYPESSQQSASWVQDNEELVVAAVTLAHELGHGLGMEHDNEHVYLVCDCPMKDCIMRNASSADTQYWSNCSLAYLDRMYKSGADYCMLNAPGTVLDPPLCGNGIVDEGEECDCGSIGCITHNCCDNSTCKFRAGAQCASGSCCDLSNCTPLSSNRICRNAKTTCDFPEYCDGIHIDCPFDLYLADGETCPEDKDAICFEGRCGSRKLQCQEIWGTDAEPAPETCYANNMNEFGCGYKTEKDDMKCDRENVLCGKLHCTHPNPPEYSIVRGWKGLEWKPPCLAYLSDHQEGYELDYHIGMTPDGTSCGDGKYCLNTKCVSKSELLKESETCDECESGVCTNLGCRCGDVKGDLCLVLSKGSSPPHSPSAGQRALGAFYIFLVWLLMIAIIFGVASIYYRIKHKENLPKIVITTIKEKFGKKSDEKPPKSADGAKQNDLPKDQT